MSAAEKLKALGPKAIDALEELDGDAGWAHAYQPGGDQAPDRAPDVRAVLDALPQIVALVRVLECRHSDPDNSGRCLKCQATLDEGQPWDDALAALDEKLNGAEA